MKKNIFICLLLLFSLRVFSLEAKDVKAYTLNNSIPVYIVKNSGRIDAMSIFVRGGSSELKKDESGYKDFLYSMILYNNITRNSVPRGDYQDKSGTKFSYYTGYDFSRLTVTSIDEYFEEGIDYLTAMFRNPIFKQDLFNIIKTNKINDFYTMIYTPESLSDYHAEQIIFENTPYNSFPFYTEESLEKISLDRIKKIYEKEFNEDKICIIVRSNINEKEILERLNKTMGVIKGAGAAAEKKSPVIKVKSQAFVKTSPDVQETSTICRYYATPASNTREYLALRVASACYDKMLGNVLRGKYGICYSCGNVITGRRINYGQDIIFSCSDFNEIKQKVSEVQNILLSGKYICSIDEEKNFVFEDLNEIIEGFKNSQLISFYTSNRSSVEILDNVYGSIRQFNNPVQVYKYFDSIITLTQSEILEAFKKYIATENSLWIGITSSEQEEKLLEELERSENEF
ncbi:MAG: insulinase family protein [Treponema sp.]|nr:insulinase family protein [Treponema sp.]